MKNSKDFAEYVKKLKVEPDEELRSYDVYQWTRQWTSSRESWKKMKVSVKEHHYHQETLLPYLRGA